MKRTDGGIGSLEAPLKGNNSSGGSSSAFSAEKYLYESNDIEISIVDDELNSKEQMILYIYEVDESLSVLHEYNRVMPIPLECTLGFKIAGDLNIDVLDLFGESLNIELSYMFSQYDDKEQMSLFTLPSRGKLDTNGKPISTFDDTEEKNVKSFQISIHKARNLIPDSYGSADSFCEIYYDDVLVHKTIVVKSTLYPEWNQSFNILYRGNPAAGVRLELYNFTFLGKGFFLGSIEISHQELLSSSAFTKDIELRLARKNTMHENKMKMVGGFLTFSYGIDYVEEGINEPNSIVTAAPNDDAIVEEADEEELSLDERGGDMGGASIPESISSMISPVLQLTINGGSGLYKSKQMDGRGFTISASVYAAVFIDSKRQEKIKKRAVEVLLEEERLERESIGGVKRRASMTGIEGKEDAKRDHFLTGSGLHNVCYDVLQVVLLLSLLSSIGIISVIIIQITIVSEQSDVSSNGVFI
jgi:hypothetical protein